MEDIKQQGRLSDEFDEEKVIPAETLAYFAGLFDGEGHVTIAKPSKRSYYIHAVIVMTGAEDVLDEMQTLFGGHVGVCKTRGITKQQALRWEITGKGAYNFLALTLPYTRIKHDDIVLATKFWQEYRLLSWGRGRQIPDRAVALGEEVRKLLCKRSPYNYKGGAANTDQRLL